MDIRSMYRDELAAVIAGMGEKPFRAKQLFSWLHEKQAASYDEMTNLPLGLRNRLAEEYPLGTLKEAAHLVSKKDGTEKFLFELEDHNVIESVLMRYHHGNSVCVSSQAGCSMGCTFCASTIGGKVRDLTRGEILAQVYETQRLTGEPVSNAVIMGTGEPLDNTEEVIGFIRLLADPDGQRSRRGHFLKDLMDCPPGYARENLKIVRLHARDAEAVHEREHEARRDEQRHADHPEDLFRHK